MTSRAANFLALTCGTSLIAACVPTGQSTVQQIIAAYPVIARSTLEPGDVIVANLQHDTYDIICRRNEWIPNIGPAERSASFSITDEVVHRFSVELGASAREFSLRAGGSVESQSRTDAVLRYVSHSDSIVRASSSATSGCADRIRRIRSEQDPQYRGTTTVSVVTRLLFAEHLHEANDIVQTVSIRGSAGQQTAVVGADGSARRQSQLTYNGLPWRARIATVDLLPERTRVVWTGQFEANSVSRLQLLPQGDCTVSTSGVFSYVNGRSSDCPANACQVLAGGIVTCRAEADPNGLSDNSGSCSFRAECRFTPDLAPEQVRRYCSVSGTQSSASIHVDDSDPRAARWCATRPPNN